MVTATLDIKVNQGSTFFKQFTFKDSNSVAIDISDWDFRGQIRKTYSDSAKVATMVCAFDTDGTNGVLNVSIADEDTAKIKVEPASDYKRKLTIYTWDLEVEYDDGTVDRVFEGNCTISPEVTR